MIGLARTARRDLPYVALLKARFPKTRPNRVSVGTGTLIGPRVLLTAGHNVYDHSRGGFATSVTVEFGGAPNGPIRLPATAIRTTTQWRDHDSRKPTVRSAFDYGVVVLEHPVDAMIRPLQVQTMDGQVLRNMTLNVFGFPIVPIVPNFEIGHMFGAHAVPDSVDGAFIEYSIDTEKGMSGGPLFDLDGPTGVPTLRGVHTWGNGSASAIRVSERVYEVIDTWLTSFRPK